MLWMCERGRCLILTWNCEDSFGYAECRRYRKSNAGKQFKSHALCITGTDCRPFEPGSQCKRTRVAEAASVLDLIPQKLLVNIGQQVSFTCKLALTRLEGNGRCRPCVISAPGCMDCTEIQRHIDVSKVDTSGHSPLPREKS